MLENEACSMKKEGVKLQVAYKGECVHNMEKCQIGCPRIYDPVCGFDGKEERTFSNECEFRVEVCNSKSKKMKINRYSSCTHETL